MIAPSNIAPKPAPLCWSQDSTDTDETTQARLHELAKKTNYLMDAKMIVFDKDGTLGDDKAVHKRWVGHMTDQLQRLDEHCDKERTVSMIDEFYDTIGWDDYVHDVIPSAPLAAGTWEESVVTLSNILTHYGYDASLAATWHLQIELHGTDEALIPNLKQMLSDCASAAAQGLIVAVCTSDERESTDKALANWNVQDVVAYSICSDEVDKPKPSPEPLYVLCERVAVTNVKAEDCIMVGDTISDTIMAREAKTCLCIGVLTGSGTAEILTDTGADIILPDVGHVPALLTLLKSMAD